MLNSAGVAESWIIIAICTVICLIVNHYLMNEK